MAAIHDPRYIEFITHLRRTRRARGLSQVELARRLSKPQSYVSKVETCERRLDVIEAADWCVALDTRLADVMPTKLMACLAPNPTRRSGKAMKK